MRNLPRQNDLFAAIQAKDLWFYLAWQDIKLRYRRSKIGPLWITLSMSIFCVSLGVVYSQIFKAPINEYLPFLSTGFVCWGLISGLLGEASNLFVDNAPYIKDIKTNLLTILLRATVRQVIIFAHNFLIVIGIYLYFGISPNVAFLLVFPGIALVVFNLFAMGVTLSFIGSRFRDVAPITLSAIQIVFFITPITWFPKLVSADSWLVRANLFAHYIDLMRSPMLGRFPEAESWWISMGSMLVLGFLSMLIYINKSDRISFWV
jgi:ABC-type polysaccharide/polyol phosphate export permease